MISFTCGPKAFWKDSTDSANTWHMPTYVGGEPGAPPPRPLSMVYERQASPMRALSIGMCWSR
ncbi:hypothetical protein D3C72_2018880 [compost metagenome]